MTMQTTSLAGGAIELAFITQEGRDPYTVTAERSAQIKAVASRIAAVIGTAKSRLDIAIYDFRLQGEAEAIVVDALRAQARNGVRTRIIYDHAPSPADAVPNHAPVKVEADQKPQGTDGFVRSLADAAQIKGVTGYRAL